jgi:uncharacterized protein (DUF927 family)
MAGAPPKSKKPAKPKTRAEMTNAGLFLCEVNADGSTGKRLVKICDPCLFSHHLATSNDDEHSLLMKWETSSGAKKRYIVGSCELHTNALELIGELANLGFYINHARGMREYFIEFASGFFDGYLAPMVLLTRRGWNLVSNQWVFAHESGVIDKGTVVNAMLRPSLRKLHEQKGTLEDWRAHVAAPLGKHKLGRLLVSVAFAGPLLHLIGASAFGVHIVADTSSGKTTLVCGAMRVWGNGHERGGYLQPWTSTVNALEKLLELLNDTLLPIDDLGTANPRELYSALYRLFNGVQRQRMNSHAELREQGTWTTPIISSGEVKPRDKLDEIKRSLMGGQEVRLIVIPGAREKYPHGVFDTPKSQQEAQDLSDSIKQAAASYYGVAEPAFVAYLLTLDDPAKVIREHIESFMATIPKDAQAEALRVARAFAVVAAAERMVIKSKIVDWQQQVETGASYGFNLWLTDRGGDVNQTSSQLNAADLLRHAVTVRESCFKHIDDEDSPNPHPVKLGYITHTKDEIWFETKALPQLFPGLNGNSSVHALIDLELLKLTKSGRNQVYRTPPQTRQRLFYVVSYSKLLGVKETLAEDDQDQDPAPKPDDAPTAVELDVPF